MSRRFEEWCRLYREWHVTSETLARNLAIAGALCAAYRQGVANGTGGVWWPGCKIPGSRW